MPYERNVPIHMRKGDSLSHVPTLQDVGVVTNVPHDILQRRREGEERENELRSETEGG